MEEGIIELGGVRWLPWQDSFQGDKVVERILRFPRMEMLFRKSELRCNDLQRRSSLDETSTWVYDEDDGMKGVGG